MNSMLCGFISVLLLSCTVMGVVEMTAWSEVDRYGRWSISNPTAQSVRLDEAASSETVAPGWVVSDFILYPTSTFSMTLQVLGSGDDDFVGIVFGYQDADHFYLLDWKAAAQSFNWGDKVAVNDDHAERGIKVKKINGSWTRDGLWGGADGLGVSTLAGPVGAGWAFNTAYTFTFDLSPGHIVISLNGGPLFDIADDTFVGGRIGGYGFSQDDLIFYDVTVSPDPRACVVNLEDFARFAEDWLVSMPFLPGDFDGDGTVEIDDLAHLAFYWLQPCPAGWPLK
ncbi:MAG TPA: hypothetical protein PKB02_16560 [Anaerohalosphaeraceae bacterium]|nr:hypothetical protein [Anaerohalosphaeraceae bacterium]